MRVFIAIEFNDKTKNRIAYISNEISRYSKAGNYTPKDNLHITIKFIGQIEKNNIQTIQTVMENTAQTIHPFTIILNDIGRFIRRGKNLIWLGARDGVEKLAMLHNSLDKGLSTYGFPEDKKKFTPHITIGREIVLPLPFDKLKENITVEPIPVNIDSLTLMESTRIDGKLVYIPIYRCPLG